MNEEFDLPEVDEDKYDTEPQEPINEDECDGCRI